MTTSFVHSGIIGAILFQLLAVISPWHGGQQVHAAWCWTANTTNENADNGYYIKGDECCDGSFCHVAGQCGTCARRLGGDHGGGHDAKPTPACPSSDDIHASGSRPGSCSASSSEAAAPLLMVMVVVGGFASIHGL
eukprot:CAMPEP_0180627330 /NCGR_PEP_ID=MMETSP1037_2-20121125/38318_1 /TAXON_ID=632150 /ORGANISM="Azadinium spinosum, Strain 3D9" /LENGTH=135 /DNA_ID=CAMNT_0022647953 /DNA_START=76 /DNA_END=483 /DNA_ORIENTATION=-